MGATMVWTTHASSLVGLLMPYCYASLVLVVLMAAVGVPIPIGALFVGLGALSVQPHGPNFLALALLGTAAAVSGHVLDYGLGRVGRPVLYAWLLRPFLKFSGIGIKDATTGMGRSSGMTIFLTRFALTPLASPLSILAGVVRAPLVGFLVWDALGDAVAVVGNLTLGRRLDSGFTTHGPHAEAFWGVLAFAGAAPTLLFLVVLLWRTACRRTRQLAGSHPRPALASGLIAFGSIPSQESASAAAKNSMEADRGTRRAKRPRTRRLLESIQSRP
jgi:membrane protein DedA with SNARE-associated domain